ncbi:MAG: PorV/PorQ family protein [Candidatus Wallbacteria bacterium]
MKPNKNKIIALISAIIVLTTTFVSTANAGSAGGAAAYLKMGVSARALGMGEAFTAVADDASATYYNPAGLGGLKKREFTTMHAMLKLDRKFDFANYVLPDPKRNGTWGFSWTKFGVDEIPETQVDAAGNPVLDANGNVKIFSYFSDSENNYTLSYGKQRTDKVRLGANIKYLTHSLFDKSANGIGMDFGYHITSDEKTSFGVAVKNVGAKLKWNTEGNTVDSVPVTTVLGAAYKYNPKVLTAVDFEKTGNEDIKVKLGVEGKVTEKIALRGGVNNKKFSIGAGFTEKEWHFDYAFYDEELGANQRISAGRRF